MSIHIRPTAALAERALLPEDPGAAMALAQALLERPLMFNHSRGLWGYTGLAADGRPLTVQSTGMGGASAAIVLGELITLGLRRAIRVGTCCALDGALDLGDLIIADTALAADGASHALGAGSRVQGDPDLTAALREAAPGVRHGLVASTDLFYRPGGLARWTGGRQGASWPAAGALAAEMETAALFTLGALRGIPVACVLVISDLPGQNAPRIDDDGLGGATERAGRLAADATLDPSVKS